MGELDELIAKAEYEFQRRGSREQALTWLYWAMKGHPTQTEHAARRILARGYSLTQMMKTLRERGLLEEA